MIAILMIAIPGLYFWSGWIQPPVLETENALPTQSAAAVATSPPPSPTIIAAEISPTPSVTSSPTATEPPTATAPPTATPKQTETAVPSATPTREPWPTIDPALLPRPPEGDELDLSRPHLWFGRPVDGNNNPAAPYRFGMTYDHLLLPHHGVDMANETGTPVLAVGPATVFYAGPDTETLFGPQPDFYGQLVVLQLDQQWEETTIYALYGHLDAVTVSAGQQVSPGERVGLVGSSGIAVAPHLHFEIRQGDPYDYESVRNPELWYQPLEGRGVLAGRLVSADNYFLPGSRIQLTCSDGAYRYVDTYWDDGTIPDDLLGENFVISDLPKGSCRLWVELGEQTIERYVEIQPGALSGVILRSAP